jgi:nitrogen regulatory protein PII
MARAARKIDAIEGWLRGVEQFLSVACVADEAVDVIFIVIITAAAAEKLGDGLEIFMCQVWELHAFGVGAIALGVRLKVRR